MPEVTPRAELVSDFFLRFDRMPPVRRAFIDAYGVAAYEEWRKTKAPMSTYETLLRQRLGFHDTTPVVWNEYKAH